MDLFAPEQHPNEQNPMFNSFTTDTIRQTPTDTNQYLHLNPTEPVSSQLS